MNSSACFRLKIEFYEIKNEVKRNKNQQFPSLSGSANVNKSDCQWQQFKSEKFFLRRANKNGNYTTSCLVRNNKSYKIFFWKLSYVELCNILFISSLFYICIYIFILYVPMSS
jgi:hypothetical protein